MAKEAVKQRQELVKAPAPANSELAVPDYLKVQGRAPRGGEEVESGDLVVPRLALCQSMTPQRKRNDPKFIPGLEEGMYFNNVTNKIYGTSVNVVPVFFFRTRIRFNPMDDGGGIRCQAQDGKHGVGDPGGDCSRCKLQLFSDGEPPECTEFKNLAAIVAPERGMPSVEDALVIGFKSSGLQTAKAWNTMIRQRGLDHWASVFTLTSATKKNDKGEFFVPKIDFAKELTSVSSREKGAPPSLVSREMYQIGETIYTGMQNLRAQGRLKVDFDEEVTGREPGDDTNEM